MLGTGDVLAVDLGSHSVRVMHLRATGRRPAVLGYAARTVWRELAEAKGEDAQREVYARVLKELVAQVRAPLRTAAVSLPGNTVLVRFMDVTGKKRFDPRTGIPEDALALIPHDPAEAAIDWRKRPAGGDPGREEMMIVAAARKAVADGVAILQAAGLSPASVVSDALAVGDADAYFHAGRQTGLRVLVNAGAATTSVSIVEDGVCRAVRVINVAGNAFTRAVRRELGVETEAAEDLKERHGLTGPPEEGTRVRKALMPVVKDLCVEVGRTIHAFLDKRQDDRLAVAEVLLSGGSADMAGLAEAMAEELDLPVSVFRPLTEAHAPAKLAGLRKSSAGLAVAAGLGAAGAVPEDSPHQRFNLGPRAARGAAALRSLTSRLVVAAAVVAVAVAASGLWAYEQHRRRLEEESTRFEASLAAARTELAARRAARAAKAAKRKENPGPSFGYLRGLQVNGVFGGGAFVMLSGGDRVFAFRAGRLYDEDEKPVPGVSAAVEGGAVVLNTVRGERIVIPLPK